MCYDSAKEIGAMGRRFLAVLLLLGLFCAEGCLTTSGDENITLSKDEIAMLRAKKPCVLSADLRRRLLDHAKELELTPEERRVLESTGKVVLCGKCGYILNSLKYKRFKENNKADIDPETGFAKDSIRERLLKATMD